MDRFPFTFNVIPIVICNVVVDITCNDPFTIVGDTSTSVEFTMIVVDDIHVPFTHMKDGGGGGHDDIDDDDGFIVDDISLMDGELD